jgi:predicted component of type VI protein secretion system
MIQIKVVSGLRAGDSHVARRFPVRVGRSPKSHLKLEDAGTWDDHCEVLLDRSRGFLLKVHPNAMVTVNRDPVPDEVILRNGDHIQVGGATLSFWLAETTQHGFRVREFLVWTGIILLTASQIALIYFLSQ